MSQFIRIALFAMGALFASVAFAQPAPDDQEPGDASDQPDPPSRVARLAFVRGAVSFVPAGENDWVEAQLNRPVITGDKLWTDHDARAELEIGSAVMRIDEQTSFDFLNLDDQTAQVELTQGALNLRVRRFYDNQVYEIDTPTLAFVIDHVGEYRVSVAPNGDATIVSVLRGSGDAYGEGGARFRIEEGQSVTFNDSQLRDYYTDALPDADAFDNFIAQRDQRWDRARSREYVSEDVIGYEDLDDNGEWSDAPEYGHVWYPTTVAVGWTPYHDGHWGWVGAYGWTWIDDAPWGFAPFHYGRWAYIGNRWGWCPGPRSVRPYYAPALVAFIGGGVGVGVAVGGPVGWFPLGPRDVYFPGYRVSRGYFTRVNVSNTVVNTTVINNYYGHYSRGDINYGEIGYHNRGIAGAVIAVPAAAFVGARPVHTAAIAVNRETFANAHVSAFAAVAPTRASLVASTARPGRTPPVAVLDRKIVAASKPPPPIAPFAAREALLQKNPGRPLNTRELHALPAVQNGGGARNASIERANVKIVTNNGAPAKTAAAPLVLHGNPQNGNGQQRMNEARRAGNATGQQQDQGINNAGRDTANGRGVGNAAGSNAGNNARVQGGGPQNEHVQSSRFAHGNASDTGAAGNGKPNANAAPAAGRGVVQENSGRPAITTQQPASGNALKTDASNGGNGNGNPREHRSEQHGNGGQGPTGSGGPQGQGQGQAQSGRANVQQEYRQPRNADTHGNDNNAAQQQQLRQQQIQQQQQQQVQQQRGQQPVQHAPPQGQGQGQAQGQGQGNGKDKEKHNKDDDKKHGGGGR